MSATTTVTPAKVKAALKVGTAYVATHDERPWIGTSYWAADASIPGAARRTLEDYNLGAHRGRLEVNGSITAMLETDAPNIGQIVTSSSDGPLVDLEPFKVAGAEVHAYSTAREVSLYTAHDGRIVAVDSAYAAIFGDAQLQQNGSKPMGAVVAYDTKEARFVGVVMPVRLPGEVK
ncbi:MAG: hypothetical protein LC750_07515 [Actinobacteria bacterium]|nr:hypothetical protein [Actinomycetota bacterium]